MTDRRYPGPERRANGGEAFGQIKTLLEGIAEDVKEIKGWQYQHDGQGEATTHAAIKGKLDKLRDGQVKANTIFGFLQAIGYTVLGWLGLK